MADQFRRVVHYLRDTPGLCALLFVVSGYALAGLTWLYVPPPPPAVVRVIGGLLLVFFICPPLMVVFLLIVPTALNRMASRRLTLREESEASADLDEEIRQLLEREVGK